MRIRVIRIVERGLPVAGISLLVIYVDALIYRTVAFRQALERFHTGVQAAGSAMPDLIEPRPADEVDFSLWSEKRVRASQESPQFKKNLPMAVLRIERLGIRVRVFEGTASQRFIVHASLRHNPAARFNRISSVRGYSI